MPWQAGRYFAGADVGEGARWSADRKRAYRLRGGKVEEEISLEEAARIAGALGIAVPAPSLNNDDDEEGVAAAPEQPTTVATMPAEQSVKSEAPTPASALAGAPERIVQAAAVEAVAAPEVLNTVDLVHTPASAAVKAA